MSEISALGKSIETILDAMAAEIVQLTRQRDAYEANWKASLKTIERMHVAATGGDPLRRGLVEDMEDVRLESLFWRHAAERAVDGWIREEDAHNLLRARFGLPVET